MKIQRNSEWVNLVEGCNVTDALQQWGYQVGHVAVALNQTFLPQQQYASVYLQENDEIMIVAPMQGG